MSRRRSVFPNQNNSVMLRLWVLQGRVWHSLKLSSRDAAGFRGGLGVCRAGEGDRDSAGTHLG